MRQLWGFVGTGMLTGLLCVAVAAWVQPVSPPPVPAVPAMAWEPMTLGMAVLLADYADREDWSGCETRGVSPLFVRCPDGYALEVR